jgi:hypothetical protein
MDSGAEMRIAGAIPGCSSFFQNRSSLSLEMARGLPSTDFQGYSNICPFEFLSLS